MLAYTTLTQQFIADFMKVHLEDCQTFVALDLSTVVFLWLNNRKKSNRGRERKVHGLLGVYSCILAFSVYSDFYE